MGFDGKKLSNKNLTSTRPTYNKTNKKGKVLKKRRVQNMMLIKRCSYLTIRLRVRVFYEQIVNEAQPSWLSLVENEGE